MKLGIGSRVHVEHTVLTETIGFAGKTGEVCDIDCDYEKFYTPFQEPQYLVEVGVQDSEWIPGSMLRGIQSQRNNNKEDKC